jgi:outer membrane protein
MKNISLIISIILALLLGYAFYQIHDLKKQINGAGTTAEMDVAKDSTSAPVVPISTKLPEGKIAFINVDSLDAQYDYFKDITKSFASERNAIEGQLQNQAAQLEKEYVEFQQAVQAGIRPQADLEKDQQKLMAKKQNLDGQQGRLETLANKMADKQLEVRKDLAKFLDQFNAGRYDYILPYSGTLTQTLYVNPKLDVTAQVVAGLNAAYKAKKK